MESVKKHIEWLPAILIIIILAGSLPYKFTDAPITVHIFDVVGEFLGLDFFRTSGAYIIGAVEGLISVLMLIPVLRVYGAVLAVGTMAGAITFHLFSPLGVTVKWMENGEMQTDGTLFYTAVLVFLAALWIVWHRRNELFALIGRESTPAD